jgi:hypothetical protein
LGFFQALKTPEHSLTGAYSEGGSVLIPQEQAENTFFKQ